MNNEISAFHPGEAYGNPVGAGAAATQLPGVSPLDGWSDSKFSKPEAGKLVMGWTGRVMCHVLYDHARHVWVTNNGTPVKVFIWKKEE